MSDLCWFEPDEYPAWRRRLELERRAGNLTALRRDALRALLAFYGMEGLWPSDAAVAELAGVSARTVRRARADARALGMLTWEPTRKLVAGRGGGPPRWRQGPNRYTVVVPAGPVCPGGQADRRRKKDNQERGLRAAQRAQPAPVRAAYGLPPISIDLLAARRAAFERQQREALR